MTRPGAAIRPIDRAPGRRWGDDLAVPMGLGTNTFGRTTDAAASHRVLDAFAEAGGVLVDTADTYSDGASEVILGDWMRGRNNRAEVVVTTKCGNHPPLEGLSATTVAAAAEESLRRLGTDYIDLYFAHYQDDRDADRGDGGRVRRPDPGRQDPGRRAVKLHRRCRPRVDRHGCPKWLGRTDSTPTALQLGSSAAVRDGVCSACERGRSCGASLPCSRWRIPVGQVPHRGRHRGPSQGSRRPTSDHPQGTAPARHHRRDRPGAQRQGRRHRSRLADAPPHRYSTASFCHLRCAA